MPWLFVFVCLLQAAPAQVPARDTSPSKPATAVIRGRITDKESGQPIPGALVAIRSGRDSRTIVADADGRYEFTALPAGAYLVMADGGFERATHLTHVLGDPRPLESTIDLLNKTFMLKDGEVRGDADILLTRAGAIEGRVIDGEGEPMTGVEVTASPAERRLADLASAYTDDRGLFRLYGLAPGAYRVCAEPKGGRFAYSRYLISTDSVGRLMKTCFPDAATAEDAKSVEVGRSLTPAVEIIIRTYTASKVSGTILDNAGAPVRDAFVTLLRTDRERDRFYGRVDAAGRFVINDVPAGKYLLHAAKTTRDGPPRKGEAAAGYLPVTVEGADVEGLVVSIGPGAVVGGHVTFLDGAAPRNQKIAMKVQASPGSSMALASWLSVSDARVSESSTFELADLFLPATIVAHDIPDGWAVASIRYRGRDVRNVPVRFETDRDPRALEIQLTSKVGELSGKVLGESDTPVTMACIVAVGANAPRPLAVTAFTYAFADTGVFRLPSLPAGAYTVAAVAPSGCVELRESPAVFDELGAQAVTLGVGERRTMDLRLSSLPAKR